MHVTAWQDAFAGIGKPFDRQRIHDQIGKDTDMLVPTLLPDLEENEQEKLGQIQGAIFKRDFLNQVNAFPNARDLLLHVHERGKKAVLASSATKAELDHYIELLDARDPVHATTSGDDVEQTKPAPDIFATALSKLEGITAAEALVVGDTPYDIEAAAKCNIAGVAVRSGGFDDETLRKAGAIAIYDDIRALLADYEISPLGRAADGSSQARSQATEQS